MSPIGTDDEAYEVGSIDVEFLLLTLVYVEMEMRIVPTPAQFSPFMFSDLASLPRVIVDAA